MENITGYRRYSRYYNSNIRRVSKSNTKSLLFSKTRKQFITCIIITFILIFINNGQDDLSKSISKEIKNQIVDNNIEVSMLLNIFEHNYQQCISYINQEK